MTKLYEHQREGIKAAYDVLQKTRGFYLVWDPGLGKTLAAITLARLLGCERVLVLAPVVALGVWAGTMSSPGEIQRWWPEADALIVRNGEWNLSKITSPRFLVTNYNQIVGNGSEPRLKMLLRLKYDMLILDESQSIKSPSAKTTRAVYKLASRSKHRLLLSGTPAHTPLDWWSQLRLIAPHEPMWAQRFSQYRSLVSMMGGPTGKWVKGFKDSGVGTAMATIKPYSHAVKSDVLKLPDPITSVTPIQLSKQEREAYHQMEDALIVELAEVEVMTAQIVLTKMLRLQQITAGRLQEHGVTSSKLAACLELIDQRSEQKVVVACRFRWEIAEIVQEMHKIKRPCAEITGDTKPEDRKDIEVKFQTTKEPMVLVLQYKAGGLALTLTAAYALILYSFEHSYISYQQMIGRCFRIGLDHTLQILPLVASDTLDETVYSSLLNKASNEDLAKLLLGRVKR